MCFLVCGYIICGKLPAATNRSSRSATFLLLRLYIFKYRRGVHEYLVFNDYPLKLKYFFIIRTTIVGLRPLSWRIL